MLIEKIKKLIEKNKKIKSKNAAILLIWAIEHNLPPSLVLITESDIQELSKSGIIYLNNKGKPCINYNMLESTEETVQKYLNIKHYVEENIQQYRNLWKGLFTGSMGTPAACVDKIVEWLNANPQYTFEDIIKAANYWIENKKKEVSNPSLIGQADYFIFKKTNGTVQSRLSAVIEEALAEDTENSFETII